MGLKPSPALPIAVAGCRLQAARLGKLSVCWCRGCGVSSDLKPSRRPSTKVQIPAGLTQSFRLPKYINLIPSTFTVKGILKSRGPLPCCTQAEGSLSRDTACCFLPFFTRGLPGRLCVSASLRLLGVDVKMWRA